MRTVGQTYMVSLLDTVTEIIKVNDRMVVPSARTDNSEGPAYPRSFVPH